MPSTLKTPGVVIEEINLLPASVAQVATAIPAFVGYTEKIPPLVDGNIPPTRITSMLEYEQIFGGPDKRVVVNVIDTLTTPPAVDDVEVMGPLHILYYCMKMYFDNGGGPCYIASAGTYPAPGEAAISITKLQPALNLLEFEDEPTLIVMPELIHTSNIGNWGTVATAILAQCAKLQDRFAILDTHMKNYTHSVEIQNFRDNIGTQNLKYGACYYPRLNTPMAFQFEASDPDVVLINDVEAEQVFTITGFLAEYPAFATFVDEEVYPAIEAEVLAGGYEGMTMTLPPSAAIAGVYAATDRTRGVWKAPANVSLTGVTSPTLLLTNAEQEDLNIPNDGAGKSVNAIRSFTGKGIMVWGARTLDGNSSEWKYVPVRRLFITMEESIKKATHFVVFEPNDANTWVRVRNMIENYLNGLWKQGAFAGAKPEDAYFVNIGLGETMTAQDILEGKLIVEIGVAAVRPAEFIVLRFTHKLQES